MLPSAKRLIGIASLKETALRRKNKQKACLVTKQKKAGHAPQIFGWPPA